MSIVATVVIPARNRENSIDRAIGSIANTGVLTNRGAWEIIVIDDASEDKTRQKINKWVKKYPQNIICIKFNEHQERAIATNSGYRYARGDWIIRLDSDDELASHFKQAFEDAIEIYPKAKVLTWSSVVHWRDGEGRYHRTDVRHPGQLTTGVDGKIEPFKSGVVCSGGFAFHRDMLWSAGYLPAETNPFAFGRAAKKEHKEIAALYGDQEDLGNPWGDDYVMFFKLTRLTSPQNINQILHIQHVRQ